MQALDTPAYSVSHRPEILSLNIQFVPSYLFAAESAVDYSLIPATLHYSVLLSCPKLSSSLMSRFHFDITRQTKFPTLTRIFIFKTC